LNVDPSGTSGLRRYEPRLAPAKGGGAWACYTAGGNIRIRYIPSDITSTAGLGQIVQFPGIRGSIAVDNDGNLHVAYINNGVKYRKITVNATAIGTLCAGDFNGDGFDDPATYDPESFTWNILNGKYTNTILASGLQFGEEGYVPFVGHFKPNVDFDQIGIFNADTGTWKYRDVSDKLSVTTIRGWGTPGMVPVPADYDGDGIDDLGLYDPDTGAWFAKRTDGKIIVWADIWGGGNRVPVLGDYDGDGKDDLAVFDENTGLWFIRSVTGTKLAWNIKFGWPGVQPVCK